MAWKKPPPVRDAFTISVSDSGTIDAGAIVVSVVSQG